MLFNYNRGPRGPQGIQGPPGPSGAQGPPGSGSSDAQLRIDFENASGVWVKDGINLGLSGSGVFTSKDAFNRLQFKKLIAGNNIGITGNDQSLTISTPAEVNTASNVGTGVGVFDSKSGVDLRFRKILGGSGIEVRASGQTIILDNELVDDFYTLNTSTNKLRTDFTNSSGVFQAGTDVAYQVRSDFTNASGNWLNRVKKILTVSKDPLPGVNETNQFGTIKAAVDFISDNSENNPYCIKVGPGVFNEDPIVMKSFVSVEGCGSEETIIFANNPNANLITGADESIIYNCLLTGASGVNKAAVYYSSASEQSRAYFIVDNCRMGKNFRHILCEGAASGSNCIVLTNNLKFGGHYPYVHGFVALANGSRAGRIQLRDATSTGGHIQPFPTVFALASGPGTEILINGCTSNILNGPSTTDCLKATNGGRMRVAGMTMRQWGRAIFIENSGVAPTLQTLATLPEDCTMDVVVEHPGASGNFFGVADRHKISINSKAHISVLHLDPTEESVCIAGSLRLGDKYTRLTDVTDLIQRSTPVGVIEGGQVIRGSGTYQVDVLAGSGYAADILTDKNKRLAWPRTTLNLASGWGSRYIYVNTNNTILSALSEPSNINNILLSRVIMNASGIDFICEIPQRSHFMATHINEFLRTAIGPVFVQGCITTSGVARTLDVTSGNYWFGNLSFTVTGSTSGILFDNHFHTAGQETELANQSVVINTHYDNLTNLTPIASGKYVKHVLYVIGDSMNGETEEEFSLLIGQNQYDTLIQAQDADLPLPQSIFKDAVVNIAAIIVQQGNPDIVSIIDIRPRIGFAAPTIGAASDHGNLLGLSDDDHLQYLLVSGLRAMIGNLSLGGNDITNVGLVDGADVAQLNADFYNASGVWVKDGTNLGTGKNIFKQKNASKNLEFRSLVAGSGIQLTESGTEIRIDDTYVDDFNKLNTNFANASGTWVKNGTNLGATGSGIFVQKNAQNILEFKKLKAGTNIVFGGDNNSLTIGVVGSGIPPQIATNVKNIAAVSSVGTITRYAPEDHQHQGLHNIQIRGNTSNNSETTAGNLFLYGGNSITLYQATGAIGASISISGPSLSIASIATAVKEVASAGSVGTITRYAPEDHAHRGLHRLDFVTFLTNNTVGTTTRSVYGDISLYPQGAIYMGWNGAFTNALEIIGYGWVSVQLSGNTAGEAGPKAMYGSLGVLAGGNNITLSGATDAFGMRTITISGPNIPNMISVGMSNIGNTSGNTGLVSNQFVLAGGNNITLSQSTDTGGATLTISSPNMLSVGLSTQGNTAGNTGLISGRLVLVGSNSGGNSIVLSGSTNGQSETISIINSLNEPGFAHNIMGASVTGGLATLASSLASMMVFPLFPGIASPIQMALNTLNLDVSVTATANQISNAHTISVRLGIYTYNNQNGSLTLINSAETSWSMSANANNSSFYQGIRWLSLHSSLFSSAPNINFGTPYYIGLWMRTSGTGPNVWGWFGQNLGLASARSGSIGIGVSAENYKFVPFMGIYTSNTTGYSTGLPTGIDNHDVQCTVTNAQFLPHILLCKNAPSF